MKRVRAEGVDGASSPFWLFTSLFASNAFTAKDNSFSVNEQAQTTDKEESHLSQALFDESITKTDTITQISPPSSTVESKTKDEPTNHDDMYALSAMLEEEICETGVSNPSETYFCQMLQKNKLVALNTLSDLFLKNYSTDTKKVSIAVSILHLISHLQYEQIYPTGQLLALAAIGHKNKELAEYGIKCYENWGEIEGIQQLKSVHFSTTWLQEYANQVIEDLNEGE